MARFLSNLWLSLSVQLCFPVLNITGVIYLFSYTFSHLDWKDLSMFMPRNTMLFILAY